MAVIKMSKSLSMNVKYLLPPNSKRKQYAYRRTIPSDLRIFYDNKANHWHLLGIKPEEALREAEKLTKQYDKKHDFYRCVDADELKATKEAASYGLKLEPQKKVSYTMVDAGKTITFLDNHPDYERWLEDMTSQYEYHEVTPYGYERHFHESAPHHQLMLDTFQGNLKHSLKVVEEYSIANASTQKRQVTIRARFKEFTPLTKAVSIEEITKADFKRYIKHLTEKKLESQSVKTYVHLLLGALRAYWENRMPDDKEVPNWSKGLTYPKDEKEETSKIISPDHLKQIESIVAEKITDRLTYRLIAIQMNTGCRINEIAGLRKQDIQLDNDIPYILITPNKARTIKTKGSQRLIPLVGLALEAVKYALGESDSGEYLFPSMIKRAEEIEEVSNSASSLVNKWLKAHFDTKYTSHYFRHTLVARAKLSGANERLIEELFGWASKGNRMIDHYGAVSDLPRMKEVLVNAISVKDYPVF